MTNMPKIIAIRDGGLIEYVRKQRDGCCLYHLVKNQPCQGAALHAHHIETRGSGGDDTLENIITLCPGAHDQAHRGKISKEELRKILTLYFG
jgi:hypothetical protein